MFKSIYFKILLIFLACAVAVVGIFSVIMLVSTVTFFSDSFMEVMNDKLGEDSDIAAELRDAMGDGVYAEKLGVILDRHSSELGIDNSRNWYVLNLDGRELLSSVTQDDESLPITANILTAMSKQTGAQIGGNGNFVDYAIYLSGGEDECIIYVKDTLNDASRLSTSLFGAVFIAVGVSVLVTIIMSLFLTQAITYPVKVLTDKADKVAAGDFSDGSQVNSEDEFGALSDSFDYMTNSISDSIASISDEKRKFETVFSNITDAILIFDSNGAMSEYNEKAARLFGENGEKMSAHELFDALDIPLRFENKEVVFTAETDEAVKRSETGYTFDDRAYGNGVYEVNVLSMIYYYGGVAQMGLVVVLHDITERLELDKMRQEFVANVSHELRTPLTAIKGACESVLADGDMPEEIRQSFMSMSVDECDRMIRIVSDLLTLSHFDGQKMKWNVESFDLVQSVGSVAAMLQAEVNSHGHRLTLSFASKEQLITGDKARIEQVLINIMSNAIKYTQDGGEINVRTAFSDGEATVEITDNGIGISKEDIAHLFERFYRVDKSRNSSVAGTGLGLAIAKEIVDAHGGKLTVDSSLGYGTTFRIMLPVRCALEGQQSI